MGYMMPLPLPLPPLLLHIEVLLLCIHEKCKTKEMGQSVSGNGEELKLRYYSFVLSLKEVAGPFRSISYSQLEHEPDQTQTHKFNLFLQDSHLSL